MCGQHVWVLVAEDALLIGDEPAGVIFRLPIAALPEGYLDGVLACDQSGGVVVAQDLPAADDGVLAELLGVAQASLSGAGQPELGCQGGRMGRSEDLLAPGEYLAEYAGASSQCPCASIAAPRRPLAGATPGPEAGPAMPPVRPLLTQPTYRPQSTAIRCPQRRRYPFAGLASHLAGGSKMAKYIGVRNGPGYQVRWAQSNEASCRSCGSSGEAQRCEFGDGVVREGG